MYDWLEANTASVSEWCISLFLRYSALHNLTVYITVDYNIGIKVLYSAYTPRLFRKLSAMHNVK